MFEAAFLPDATDAIDPIPEPSSDGRSTLRVLLISDEAAFVNDTVYDLHDRGFAEVGAWSRLLPGPNPGEVMRVLTKRRLRRGEEG